MILPGDQVLEQYAMFATDQHAQQPFPMEGGELLLYDRLDVDDIALMNQLVSQTPWSHEVVTLFGKTWPQPRLVAYYGDSDARYTYSGTSHEPRPWTPCLRAVKKTVEQLTGQTFNSVLLNYYRDGNDSMGLHADDEPELGTNPVIASLSLGQERKIYFQHKRRRDIANLVIPLPSSSLLIMKGATQHNWKHGLRKVRSSCGPRLNLTFRSVRIDAQ